MHSFFDDHFQYAFLSCSISIITDLPLVLASDVASSVSLFLMSPPDSNEALREQHFMLIWLTFFVCCMFTYEGPSRH